jgi:hypothetical protein
VPHFGTQISNIRTFYSDIAAEGGVGLAMTGWRDCRVTRGLVPAKKVPHFGTQISNIRTFYSDIAAEGGVGLAMTVGVGSWVQA